jgi:hypothetical protein
MWGDEPHDAGATGGNPLIVARERDFRQGAALDPSNGRGLEDSTFGLMIAVNLPPSGLHYASSAQATVGMPITQLNPTVTGSPDQYDGLADGTRALDPSLDSSFSSMSQNPATSIQGTFTDPDFLTGTYIAATSGTFGAARIGSDSDARYRFTGHFNVCNQIDYSGSLCAFHFSGFAFLSMDSANNVSGTGYGIAVSRSGGSSLRTATISGSVTGARFTGELDGHAISGTFTSAGLTITASDDHSSSYHTDITASGCTLN